MILVTARPCAAFASSPQIAMTCYMQGNASGERQGEWDSDVRCEDFGLLMDIKRGKPMGEHVPCLQRRVTATDVP